MKKRCIPLLFCISLYCVLLWGCADRTISSDDATAAKETDAPTQAVPLAFIADLSTLDSQTYHANALQGLQKYADEQHVAYANYLPIENATEAYVQAIAQAAEQGAKVIICAGCFSEVPVFLAQTQFPDIHFLLLDGVPHNAAFTERTIGSNVTCILFQEEQSGFLAGYSAVRDGYTQLGFLGGMAVPSIVRYGYGFVQGADFAARELQQQITLRYHYTGSFSASHAVQTLAEQWYHSQTEVIFACGGAVGQSVAAAAEAQGGLMIGEGVDQNGLSNTVITSALKRLDTAVYNALCAYAADNLAGGQATLLSLQDHGVGLPILTSRFQTFSVQDYIAICDRLNANEIPLYQNTDTATTADLTLTNTTVVFEK